MRSRPSSLDAIEAHADTISQLSARNTARRGLHAFLLLGAGFICLILLEMKVHHRVNCHQWRQASVLAQSLRGGILQFDRGYPQDRLI